MKTAKEVRRIYNHFSSYDSNMQIVGWQGPRLLVAHIKRYLQQNFLILDVGCGTGLVGKELRECGWRGSLIGIDIAERRLSDTVKKSVYDLCVAGNAYALPFPNCSFDMVVSCAMVGLTGPKSVKEMFRVLKPGGYLACVAGYFKHFGKQRASWCRRRFRKSIACLQELPNSSMALNKNLGFGYTGNTAFDWKDEHYYFFLIRRQ
jgi:ubiquinone/menaquinone biosynthesis C-methylase UbiE